MRSARSSTAAMVRGQLALPWAADPLLIVEGLAHAARAASPTALVVPEFSVLRGAARIDLASLGTTLDGWEVKGDLDDVSRLPRQVEAYSRVFDRITLVTGARLAARAGVIVPRWWGLAVARDGGIETIRSASRNPAVDPTEVADLLWRDELVTALAVVTGRRGRGSRRAMAEQLSEALSGEPLTALVTSMIRERCGWRAAA
jgi:hypothetical protein